MRSLLPILSLLAVTACEPPAPPTPGAFTASPGATVIHTVNGNEITSDMKDTLLRQMPDQMRQELEASGQLARLDDQLIIGELLYRKALEQKLQDRPETQQTLALTARTVLADAALDAEMEKRLPDALKKAYEERAVQYKRKHADLKVIVVGSEQEAQIVQARLERGEDFKTIAGQMSKDPNTARKGGELGWMAEKDIMPDFQEAIFTATAGSVVGPLSAGGGGQIFFKVEKVVAELSLEDVTPMIEAKVESELQAAYFDELKASATIDGKGGAAGEATIVAPDPTATPSKAPAAPASLAPEAAPAAPAGDQH